MAMIRVIYRWRVQKNNQRAFKAAWAKATTAIRASTEGARGSLLLHSRHDRTMFVTIARWDTVELWQTFWKDPNRIEMQDMHALAQCLSADAFDEIEDHSI